MEHVRKQSPQAPPHTAEVQSLRYHPWGCIWPPGEAAEGTLPRNSGFPTECSTILTCWVVCSRQLHFPAKTFPRLLYRSPCSHLSGYQWGIGCIGPSISKSLRAIFFFELQTSLTLASRNSSSSLPWLVLGFVVFHVLFIWRACMHAQRRKAHTSVYGGQGQLATRSWLRLPLWGLETEFKFRHVSLAGSSLPADRPGWSCCVFRLVHKPWFLAC